MSRHRLEAFFEQHPICIFCGGATAATTQDHVPSRQLFTERWWPEGYAFPACIACNQSTRRAEQVVALLSRFGPGPNSTTDQVEFQAQLRAVQNNDPEILREMWPTPQQRANFSAKSWAKPLVDAGVIAPTPLSAKGPRLREYLRDYARKLFCALHYKEFNAIVKPQGGISWHWFTNAQKIEGKVPNIMSEFTKIPALKRTSRDLSDQFSYIFEMAIDGDAAGYFVAFRRSFAMVGLVDANGIYPELSDPGPDILRPLSPLPHAIAGELVPRRHPD